MYTLTIAKVRFVQLQFQFQFHVVVGIDFLPVPLSARHSRNHYVHNQTISQ